MHPFDQSRHNLMLANDYIFFGHAKLADTCSLTLCGWATMKGISQRFTPDQGLLIMHATLRLIPPHQSYKHCSLAVDAKLFRNKKLYVHECIHSGIE